MHLFIPERIKGDLCAGTPRNLRLTGTLNQQVWMSLSDSPDSLVFDWRPMGGRVKAATMLVHGDQDPLPLRGSEEWARVLPNARLVIVEGAGHYPHAERPEQFFPAVEAFLGASP